VFFCDYCRLDLQKSQKDAKERSLNTKNNKASGAVSKRPQLQRDYDIAVRAIFGQVAVCLLGGWQQRSHEQATAIT